MGNVIPITKTKEVRVMVVVVVVVVVAGEATRGAELLAVDME